MGRKKNYREVGVWPITSIDHNFTLDIGDCVYLIDDGGKEPLYVGTSSGSRLGVRIKEHHSRNPWDDVANVWRSNEDTARLMWRVKVLEPVEGVSASGLEAELVKTWQPPLNRKELKHTGRSLLSLFYIDNRRPNEPYDPKKDKTRQ